MNKLKHVLIILLAVIMSFILYEASPPPEKSETSFTISMDIPGEHKIKIINYGHGSIFLEKTQKNNGDIIKAKRFSSLTFTIIPDDNYEIDKVTFNNKDISYTLNSNKVTLQNITEDGTLTINFKAKPSPITPNLPSNTTSSFSLISYINNLASITYNKIIKTISYFSDYVTTGDNNIFILLSLLILSGSYMTYRSYKAIKK